MKKIITRTKTQVFLGSAEHHAKAEVMIAKS